MIYYTKTQNIINPIKVCNIQNVAEQNNNNVHNTDQPTFKVKNKMIKTLYLWWQFVGRNYLNYGLCKLVPFKMDTSVSQQNQIISMLTL